MVKGKINSTTNRKREDETTTKIVTFLSKNSNPVSTQEIADQIKKPWHSVQTRCLKLQILNKVNGFRVGRMNLWQLK